MTTPQFFITAWNWLLSDWTHPCLAAAWVAAATPTPKPGTWRAKLYKVIDLLAFNILHAKSTGVTSAALAEEIANLLQARAQQEIMQARAQEVSIPAKE